MPKNRYPDSLRLAECRDFSHLFTKLRDYYDISSYNPKDVIIEILMQQYGIDRSSKAPSANFELFKCIAFEHVPETYQLSLKYYKDNQKETSKKSRMIFRQALTIVMFQILSIKGVSQNKAAYILTSKGMSKDIKRRYHEAKKNASAVKLATLYSQGIAEGVNNGKIDQMLERIMKEFRVFK